MTTTTTMTIETLAVASTKAKADAIVEGILKTGRRAWQVRVGSYTFEVRAYAR